VVSLWYFYLLKVKEEQAKRGWKRPTSNLCLRTNERIEKKLPLFVFSPSFLNSLVEKNLEIW
jgi:hypothetical protein